MSAPRTASGAALRHRLEMIGVRDPERSLIADIEVEAVADAMRALRERIGDSEAGVGLPHWHHASGGTSGWPPNNDRDGVFVDRAVVLELIDEMTPSDDEATHDRESSAGTHL